MTQNESGSLPFKIAMEAPDACQRVVKVEIPRAEFDREYQDKLTSAVREHERPGFRKGKTPRTVVERELGDRLRVETFEDLVPRAYRAAIIEHAFFPLTEPRLENMAFEDGKDLTFDLMVEVRPDVVAKDYLNLPVIERAATVADADVMEILERLRETRAYYERAGRPAQADDQVVLDLIPLGEDGAPDEEKAMPKQRLTVGSPNNLPAFNEVLTGAEVGQERTVTVAYPEDYPNPEVRGREMGFLARVTEVRVKVIPEADDNFASQLEEGQTLLELRIRIRERLQQEAQRRAAAELDEQILAGLIDRHDVPVPPSMLEDYLRLGLEELHEHQGQAGREVTEAEDAEYREAARPIAERVIKGLFLLEAVRRQEGIEVGDAEVEDRVVAIAAENGFDLEKFRAYVGRGEERDRIRRELEERKTYDFLLSRADIRPAEAGAGPAAEATT